MFLKLCAMCAHLHFDLLAALLPLIALCSGLLELGVVHIISLCANISKVS
jgi:hypothetical protein